MTTPSVIENGEVLLGATRFPIEGVVQKSLTSLYAPRIIIGNVSAQSQQGGKSVIAWTDPRGGIGIERGIKAESVQRSWFSTGQLRFNQHLTLPRLATALPVAPVLADVTLIEEYADTMYVAFGTAIYSYSGTAWSALLHTLPGTPTDSLLFREGTTVRMVILYTTGITTFDGTTWRNLPFPAKYGETWDDALYTIDNTGLLVRHNSLAIQQAQSGAVTGVETDGSAALDDAGLVFTPAIRDGKHFVRVTDNTGRILTGYIGTTDPDGDNSRVLIFNSLAHTTQNWIEGGATAFSFADVPITFAAYSAGTNDARLPLPDGYVTDLLVARNVDGALILHAMTKVGPYIHDTLNTKFHEHTDMSLPFHPYAGLGTERWRDAMFIPAGNQITKLSTGSGGAVSQQVGPDRDHGLPSDKRGVIRQLLASQNELLAFIDISAALQGGDVLAVALFASGDTASGGHRSSVIDTAPGTGFSPILGMDEGGAWQCLWVGNEPGVSVTAAKVAGAYDRYRLWWGAGAAVYYLPLPVDIINPDQLTDDVYALSATHDFPDYDADDITSDKLALAVLLEAQGLSATQTVDIYYALDRSGLFTLLRTVQESGKTEVKLPSALNPEGMPYRSIRWRLVLNRDPDDDSSSPDVSRFEFSFRMKLPPKWGWQVTISFSPPKGKRDYKGKTAAQLEAAFNEIIQSTELTPFSYRPASTASDEDGGGWVPGGGGGGGAGGPKGQTHGEEAEEAPPADVYHVDVLQVSGYDLTGHDYRFKRRVFLAEP